MKIRVARKNDEELIRKIHIESNDELGDFNLFWIWDNFLERKNKYYYYVIDDAAFMRYGYSSQKKCYILKEIGVLKDKQGKGYAQALFNFCKRPLYLTCNLDNERGNKFYKKMGMKLKGVKTSKNGKFKMNEWVI